MNCSDIIGAGSVLSCVSLKVRLVCIKVIAVNDDPCRRVKVGEEAGIYVGSISLEDNGQVGVGRIFKVVVFVELDLLGGKCLVVLAVHRAHEGHGLKGGEAVKCACTLRDNAVAEEGDLLKSGAVVKHAAAEHASCRDSEALKLFKACKSSAVQIGSADEGDGLEIGSTAERALCDLGCSAEINGLKRGKAAESATERDIYVALKV